MGRNRHALTAVAAALVVVLVCATFAVFIDDAPAVPRDDAATTRLRRKLAFMLDPKTVSGKPPRVNEFTSQTVTNDAAEVQQRQQEGLVFCQHDASDLQILKQIHKCTKNIVDIATPWLFDSKIPKQLDCGEDGSDVGSMLKVLRSIVKKHHRIWFLGDSILRQQVNMLGCMLDPNTEFAEQKWPNGPLSSIEEYSLQKPNGNKHYRFDHLSNTFTDHPHDNDYNDTSEFGPTSSQTMIQWLKWGWKFDNTESSLYETVFPSILREATENDAIVLGGGAHYNFERMQLMANALMFIRRQSVNTKAALYYMEPTPEEWNTNNGMHGACGLDKALSINYSPLLQ